jgi:hypothetical protein
LLPILLRTQPADADALPALRYRPRRIVTDGLRSYGVARCEILPEVRHWTG